jgi:hypothetical protein
MPPAKCAGGTAAPGKPPTAARLSFSGVHYFTPREGIMQNNGHFTFGKVSFLSEQERKDGKGSYLVLYVRFGTGKEDVAKYRVWSQNYTSTDGAFELRDVSGAWARVELGSELTVYGDVSIYTTPEGNERVSLVARETAGLTVSETVQV